MSTKPQKKNNPSEPSVLGKSYLIAYNGVQTLGWVLKWLK